MLDGPSALPFAAVFFADFPISAIAFGIMFNSEALTPYAAITWGAIGTLRWYYIGQWIEERRSR
jgi:hypothetical protein